MSPIMALACLFVAIAAAQTISPSPGGMVFDVVHQTPELSIFSSLITSTGGDNVSSPELGERFNNPDDCIKYTVFAPTNDAFKNIPPATMKTLMQPYSYDLLLAIIRTHIVQGQVSPQDLMSGGKPFQAIEGFPISVGAPGNISLNQGIGNSGVPVNQTARIVISQNGAPASIPATNGVVYKIDGLSNPFASYWGIDEAQRQLPTSSRQLGKTMQDIITSSPSLTNLSSTLRAGNPEFLNRLSLFSRSPSEQNTVYLAPSDTAFGYMSPEAITKMGESGNVRLTSYLLEFGSGQWDQRTGKVASISGFNLSVVGGRAGNAGVQQRVCADNGCVWVVGRWLDPLSG